MKTGVWSPLANCSTKDKDACRFRVEEHVGAENRAAFLEGLLGGNPSDHSEESRNRDGQPNLYKWRGI
jgi:hypothetical protein